MQYIAVGAHRQKPTAADGHGLSARHSWIYRPEIAVVEDQVGFHALE